MNKIHSPQNETKIVKSCASFILENILMGCGAGIVNL